MNHYELLFILPGTLDENEAKPLADEVKKIVEKHGGSNFLVSELDKRRLAYPMKHIRYGYFSLAYFQAETDIVKKIEKELGLNRDFLRIFVKRINPETHKLKEINFGQPIINNADRDTRRDTRKDTRKDTHKSQEEEFATIKRTKKTEEIKEDKPVEKPVEKIVKEEVKEEIKPEEEKLEVKSTVKKQDKKVDLDDIDKKLDEILDIDLNKV